MKKSLKYLLLIALGIVLQSCGNGDKETIVPLATPEVTIGVVTSSSFEVTWKAVTGARQYGYRLVSQVGKDVAADVTTKCGVSISDLAPASTYSFSVIAFPEEVGTATASECVMDIQTSFYDAVVNCATEYVSHLQANVASVTNRGTINEDRTGADYEEGWYGVFTISKFCGANNHDMVFKVNRDNTIKILNGEGYDEAGRVKLKTGKSSSATLSFDYIFIDESSAVFDGPNSKLTFSAKNNGVDSKLRESTTETITWTEPEE